MSWWLKNSSDTQAPLRRRRVAIDLVPIRVGEGGTGSGIWTYARELLLAMDAQVPDGLEILCLVNEGQVPYLKSLRTLRLVCFPGGGKNILGRLWWVHVRLPMLCLIKQVDVLHKLATDTPWWCPAKRVTTIHDFYYEFLMENRPPQSIRLYERLENVYFAFVTRTCFGKSQAIIAVSEATKTEAIMRYPSAATRIHVVHHGSPSGRARLPGEPRRTARRSVPTSASASHESLVFTILCVAKFMEHKGQHLLIAAFERLLERHPELQGEVELHLRGFHNDRGYFASIRQLVSASAFAEAIHLVRFEPSEGVEAIYRAADLVALLSAYEGFGLPVLEAQSCGVPVLCSDLRVLREVGGEGAVYVSRNDVDAVADALFRFISDGGFQDEMKLKALENTGRFSWRNAAEKTLEIYRHCLDRSE